jgi:hypothetical protein
VLLIREIPATELTVATRILAHLGALAAGGRVALRVGSDVVYLAGRGVVTEVMTPYDVAAVRFGDGAVLAGDAPEDTGLYLEALRMEAGGAVAAAARDGTVAVASALAPLVERLSGLGWEAALERTRGLGGLVGAYPAEVSE